MYWKAHISTFTDHCLWIMKISVVQWALYYDWEWLKPRYGDSWPNNFGWEIRSRDNLKYLQKMASNLNLCTRAHLQIRYISKLTTIGHIRDNRFLLQQIFHKLKSCSTTLDPPVYRHSCAKENQPWLSSRLIIFLQFLMHFLRDKWVQAQHWNLYKWIWQSQVLMPSREAIELGISEHGTSLFRVSLWYMY